MNQTCNRVLGKAAPGSLSHLNCIIPSDLTTSISPLPRTSLPLHCNAQPSLQVKPKSAKTRRFHRWMISNRDNHICKITKKKKKSPRTAKRQENSLEALKLRKSKAHIDVCSDETQISEQRKIRSAHKRVSEKKARPTRNNR